jgi:hypothetical protein
MRIRKLIIAIVPLILVFTVNACNCGCGKTESNTVKGMITVIGNEPFTKLAIKTDDGKYFVLKSSRDLSEELNKNQGSFYIIQYGEKMTEESNEVLVVEKAIPLKNNSK